MPDPKSGRTKRKSKRKSRTEVTSSPSSSDSEDTSVTQKEKITDSAHGVRNSTTGFKTIETPPEPTIDAEQAFADFYLRQATREFANDLDKLRSTSDFHGQRSIEVLIESLRQGTKCFKGEERARVGLVAGKAALAAEGEN